MTNSELRRNRIVELISQGINSTVDLSNCLKATPATIRRDLDYLEEQGILIRSWGKAELVETSRHFDPIIERISVREKEKSIIAQLACSFVSEGDSIIMDSGSTVLAMANYLSQYKNLSVLTNSIPLISAFANSSVSVQVCGGYFDKEHSSLVGIEAENCFSALHVSKAFIGTTSIRMPRGLSCCSPFQSSIKRSMISAADKVYCLMDSSKINSYGINWVANMDEIDYIITDKPFNSDIAAWLKKSGVKVLVASENT